MENKNSFMERQMREVTETLAKLKVHVTTIEERLIQKPEDDEIRDLLEDAQEGIEAMEPVLADFEKAGVDPEELVKYAQVIEEWQGKEAEIAERLQK